ncbi:MAG: DUF3817 domain-containing protein [Arachnia sp.]
MAESVSSNVIDPEDISSTRAALMRYRVMAWIVGVLLAVLMLIGLPLKYLAGDGRVVVWTGVPHGWLYMILLITAYDLSRRVGWSIKWVLMIMAAGTVPMLSFVAEHFATKDVRARLVAAEAEAAAISES